jgi:hypothetical protein
VKSPAYHDHPLHRILLNPPDATWTLPRLFPYYISRTYGSSRNEFYSPREHKLIISSAIVPDLSVRTLLAAVRCDETSDGEGLADSQFVELATL